MFLAGCGGKVQRIFLGLFFQLDFVTFYWKTSVLILVPKSTLFFWKIFFITSHSCFMSTILLFLLLIFFFYSLFSLIPFCFFDSVFRVVCFPSMSGNLWMPIHIWIWKPNVNGWRLSSGRPPCRVTWRFCRVFL